MTLQKGMSAKERRMLKAARKRYRENKNVKTVAEEMNLAYQTVKNYFSGDEMKKFERYYSESDKQLLEAQLQQMVKDGTRTALDMHSEIRNNPEADARVKQKAMKEAQKIPERHIKMLQELGIIKKPKERKEIQETSKESQDVMERLQEAYEELEAGKQEAESSAD